MRHVWMISYASMVHIGWAIGLLIFPLMEKNSFVAEIVTLVGMGPVGAAAVLGIVGLLSLWGMIAPTKVPFLYIFLQPRIGATARTFTSLILALPQQFVMVISAIAFVGYFISQTVPEVPDTLPRDLIYPAMLVAVSGMVGHTFAIADNAMGGYLSSKFKG